MKRRLKNIKESYNREEKQEEDSLLDLINLLLCFDIPNFLEGFKNKILTT